MAIKVLFFGQLVDISNVSSMEVSGVNDTEAAILFLHARFPALKNVPFVVAVNNQIVQTNTTLDAEASLALLPPFSGG